MIGGVVFTGSAGHTTKLNPLADQTGYGSESVLDQATATTVAATVAKQTNLLVAPTVNSSARTLNAQTAMPTTDDGTLAPREVVDTAGSTARGIATYTVQPGDTVASVAAEFNVTSDTIGWANNLSTSATLTPDQKLTILPISGVQYTVQPGDTADSIAKHFQANADQILAFNNAQSSGVANGQTIVVPDGVMPQVAVAKPAAAAPAAPASSASSKAVSVVRGSTSNSYALGYCTWYVATRRSIPGWWGNANAWYGNAQISGYSVGSTPRVGAIAWTGAGYYGHVAYVEAVNGSTVTVSEMNWNGNWDRVDFRTASASSFRYIY